MFWKERHSVTTHSHTSQTSCDLSIPGPWVWCPHARPQSLSSRGRTRPPPCTPPSSSSPSRGFHSFPGGLGTHVLSRVSGFSLIPFEAWVAFSALQGTEEHMVRGAGSPGEPVCVCVAGTLAQGWSGLHPGEAGPCSGWWPETHRHSGEPLGQAGCRPAPAPSGPSPPPDFYFKSVLLTVSHSTAFPF